MASRFRVARLGALVAVVLAALLATAFPAAAAASGVFVGTSDPGHGVKMKLSNEQVRHGHAGKLYKVRLDGSSDVLEMYCVEIDISARSDARMIESPWSAFPGTPKANPEKLLWVLHHSYPNVDLAKLSEAVGADLDVKEALTGTQAAVWHYANGAKLIDDSYPDLRKLYDYLTGEQNTGIQEQPPASLTIDPAKYENLEAGATAGPYTIDTNAKTVDVELTAPDGVKIVDKDGNEITEFAKGTQFWLTAPAGDEGGAATVKAEVQANVEKARLFVGDPKGERTQSFVVATSDKGKATAEVTAQWAKRSVQPPVTTTTEVPPTTTEVAPSTTVAPTTTVAPPPQGGGLPVTGSTILPVLGIGLLLLGAGVGLVLLQRRRANS